MSKQKPEIESDEGPRVIAYCRVSTLEQKLDLQLDAVRKAGALDDNIHVEKVSGASKRRAALDLAIMDLREGDTLVVWRLDRLARNMRDLLARMEAIEKAGATFKSLTESFDTKTPGGRFLIYVLGAVAELERQLTIERTTAGIKAWVGRGGEPGRKLKMDKATIAKAKRLLRKEGMTVKKVAKRLRVTPSSLYNYQISKRRVTGKKT